MGNPKGGIWERKILLHGRERGFDIERLRLAGKEDEGDIVIKRNGRVYILEAKDVARWNVGGWMNEAQVEVGNYVTHRNLPIGAAKGAVVIKRRQASVARAFVVLELDDFLDIVGTAV